MAHATIMGGASNFSRAFSREKLNTYVRKKTEEQVDEHQPHGLGTQHQYNNNYYSEYYFLTSNNLHHELQRRSLAKIIANASGIQPV